MNPILYQLEKGNNLMCGKPEAKGPHCSPEQQFTLYNGILRYILKGR